ncbi:MAG: nucleotidyltransferase domain-containing protein [Candidatus Caenarcaniphilales bacterium]|nr:nucleotidyltransferase domain-containing protein [Candidatus Caenarcaniphilales bacterium]
MSLDFLEKLVQEITQTYPVARVILFGSRARGDHDIRSDIDLAIDAPELTQADWLRIIELVEEAPTLLPIDCVLLQEASRELVSKIEHYGVTLYERKANPHD